MTTAKKTSSKEVKSNKKKREASDEQKAARRTDMLREPLIDKALEDNGIVPPDAELRATLKERGLKLADAKVVKAELLDAHYRNTIPKEFQAACLDEDGKPGCGYVSDAKLPSCPFCGDGEVVPADRPEVEAAKSLAVSSPAPIVDGEIVEDEDVRAKSLADLDAAVARVHLVVAESLGSYWDLGAVLAQIFDRQLYLQRRNEQGGAKYRNWTAFLVGEFGGQISVGHSYRVMEVARKFDRQTAIQLGSHKMTLLCRAKPEALPKLLEIARQPATTFRELHEIAKPDLIEAGQREPVRGAGDGKGRSEGSAAGLRAGVANAAAKGTARAENAITVASQIGTVVLPMKIKGSDDKIAKKLADDPWAKEEHVNGVVTTYYVEYAAAGGLQLRIVRRRVNP